MPEPIKHHYHLVHLHLACLGLGVILLGVILWTLRREFTREWHIYQLEARKLIDRIGDDLLEGQSQANSVQTILSIKNQLNGKDEVFSQGGARLWEIRLPQLPVSWGNATTDRVDRCMSCHQFIDRTGRDLAEIAGERDADGDKNINVLPWEQATSLSDVALPLFPKCQTRELILPLYLPGVGGAIVASTDSTQPTEEAAVELSSRLGIIWSKTGWVRDGEPRIAAIVAGSPAEAAGLRPGDLVLNIGSRPIKTSSEAEECLREYAVACKDGIPDAEAPRDLVKAFYPARFGDQVEEVPGISLTIERGLSHPLTGHPRPDLFVEAHSPHPVHRFGCTICHDGQGLGTSVAGAEHYRSAHTDFYSQTAGQHAVSPMPPPAFIQSRCLRCHGLVCDLVETESYLVPPAERLVEGRRLIEQYGCYACHNLNTRSAQEFECDLVVRTAVVEIAEEVLALDPPAEVAEAAQKNLSDPPNPAAQRALLGALRNWQKNLGSDPAKARDADYERLKLGRLLAVLQTENTRSGGMGKPGPSLRLVAARFSPSTLRDMIRNPQKTRPGSRMPQLFDVQPNEVIGSIKTKEFEAVEIEGIVEYLLADSQKYNLTDRERPVFPSANSSRFTEEQWKRIGRKVLATQGCLACHAHREFPEITANFGPDLSHLGQRLTGTMRREWLWSWLVNPRRLSPSTRMPQPQFRENSWLSGWFTEELGDAGHQDRDGVTKRAAPEATLSADEMRYAIVEFLLDDFDQPLFSAKNPFSDEIVDVTFKTYLAQDIGPEKADHVLENGISPKEIIQYGPTIQEDLWELQAPLSREKKLRYIGKKAIGRYGCYACHSISGFEGQPPIGPDLSAWAKKPLTLLDFVRVTDFFENAETDQNSRLGLVSEIPEASILGHRTREAWLFLKLTEPRIFDHGVSWQSPLHTLRMGRFPLSARERLAIMTFILGLDDYAVPPEYSPYSRSQTLVRARGRTIWERYGCGGCHMIRPEAWIFRYLNSSPPVPPGGFALVDDASLARGVSPTLFAQALAVGRPVCGTDGKPLIEYDEWDNPLYFFELWRPIRLAGGVWYPHQASLPISEPQILMQRAQDGGTWGYHLYRHLREAADTLGYTVGSSELWGAVPPALCYEGLAVQEDWLRGFLKMPETVRPAVPLSMPVYYLKDYEREALVAYFLSQRPPGSGNGETPQAITRKLQERDAIFPGRLEAALRLIQDSRTYCGKCHHTMQENRQNLTSPQDAPSLTEVYRRLRGEYLEKWIENPRAILPYTAMPVNFPPGQEALDRSVFDATADIQRAAVTDLLRYYDWFLKQRGGMRPDSGSPPDEEHREQISTAP